MNVGRETTSRSACFSFQLTVNIGHELAAGSVRQEILQISSALRSSGLLLQIRHGETRPVLDPAGETGATVLDEAPRRRQPSCRPGAASAVKASAGLCMRQRRVELGLTPHRQARVAQGRVEALM